MHSKTAILKCGLMLFILLSLWMPVLQNKLRLINLYALAGDKDLKEDTSLTPGTYLSGIYQAKMDKHLARGFGFRSLLIKANNQFKFNLFGMVNAKGVIPGKDQYLFETTYIHSYQGLDFMGTDSIKRNLNRLKIITDQLAKYNKQLIVVITPSKPSFYHEFLPDFALTKYNHTNYEVISKEIKKRRVHCLDFSKWFNDMKKTSLYPLYPKHGNHWSNFGAYLAADSLLKYIESVRKTELADLVLKKVRMEQPKNEDKDIEYGINLLFKLKSFDLAYPELEVRTNVRKKKPKLLVIGDSFYWNLYHMGFPECFSEPAFWYYNKAVYPSDNPMPLMTEKLNKSSVLKQQDVIIILATESNIKSFGWGFLEDAEDALNQLNHPVIDQSYTPDKNSNQ